MTLKEFLDWCSHNGTGIALFCLFVLLPAGAALLGFAKWAVKTAAGTRPCPQCGWPKNVINKAPGAPQDES